MIQSQTYLNIADNTGAKKIMCIKILGNNKSFGKIGDFIIGVVKEANPNRNIKKAMIVKALIIRTKKNFKRFNGITINFSENAAIIVNNDNNPKGTRIFGPIPNELRKLNLIKIISLAKEII